MEIEKIVVGDLLTNCYVITKDNKSIIIDPGSEGNKIIQFCKDKDISGILVTHGHFDHVGALKEVEDYFKVKRSNEVDGFSFDVIKTPGHTSDSVSFYFNKEKVLFCGDFIFKNSIGRMDLPTGSVDDMKKSLDYISKFDDNIDVYPGHGMKTNLGEEKKNFKFYF
ncbi:MAG: MBL fold metallo-hydrolase [Bacilli bacterium]